MARGRRRLLAFALGSRSASIRGMSLMMSSAPPSHPILSKDVILAPLVTIWYHWLLEKEKKVTWERMLGKVTQEKRGRHKHKL